MYVERVGRISKEAETGHHMICALRHLTLAKDAQDDDESRTDDNVAVW